MSAHNEFEDDPDPAATCTSEISEEPAGWRRADFDASAWPAAIEYGEADVSPKHGHDQVHWDASARLLWSASLQQDNTLLCRAVVDAE